jgi:hypothetical protein
MAAMDLRQLYSKCAYTAASVIDQYMVPCFDPGILEKE